MNLQFKTKREPIKTMNNNLEQFKFKQTLSLDNKFPRE